jgi:NADH-quinone oxidoreductase subunit K
VLPVSYYILLSTILFSIGVLGFLIRRNVLVIFMSVELMLNAANLAFISFAKEMVSLSGQVIVFLVMTVAAAEAGVGLAIIILFYRNRKSANVDDGNLMKW